MFRHDEMYQGSRRQPQHALNSAKKTSRRGARNRTSHGDGSMLSDRRYGPHTEVYWWYTTLQALMKGAELLFAANATVVLLAGTLPNRDQRLMFLVVSCLFSLVTLTTWTRGATISGPRLNLLDFIVPMALGVAEISLFLIVAPFHGSPLVPIQFWYAAFAVHAALAMLLVFNRSSQTPYQDFADDLRAKARLMARWMRKDIRGILIPLALGCVGFVSHLAFRGALAGAVVDAVLATVLSIGAVLVIRQALLQRGILWRARTA